MSEDTPQAGPVSPWIARVSSAVGEILSKPVMAIALGLFVGMAIAQGVIALRMLRPSPGPRAQIVIGTDSLRKRDDSVYAQLLVLRKLITDSLISRRVLYPRVVLRADSVAAVRDTSPVLDPRRVSDALLRTRVTTAERVIDSLRKAIRASESRKARALLVTARRMRVGKDTLAEIRLTRGALAQLTRGIDSSGQVSRTTTPFGIGAHVTARLTEDAENSFAIVPLDFPDRLLTDSLSWRFRVTALRAGTLSLTAQIWERVSAEVNDVGQKVETGPSHRVTFVVPVEANWSWTAEHFVSTNWAELGGFLTGIGGIIAWLYARRSSEKTGA